MGSRLCSVEECKKPHAARGYCKTHWKRWKKHGAPIVVERIRGTCSVEGCGRAHKARGYCSMHWSRWKKHGDPQGGGRWFAGDLLDKMAARLRITDNGCYEWDGALSGVGYGSVNINTKTMNVHRAAYQLLVRELSPKEHLDHLCRNRACFNPDHLEPVTQAENNRRAWQARKAVKS